MSPLLQNILLSLPVTALFAFLLLRCLAACGAPVPVPFPKRGASWAPGRWPPVVKVFLFALAFRAAMLFAAVAAVRLQSEGSVSLTECFASLQRWDARHYLHLIEQGYAGYTEDGRHLFLVFFPGYVWLTRLVSLLIPDTVFAGTAVSVLCFAWGCCWVYRIGTECWSEPVARDGVLLLCCFPFSFFYGMVMTESLFLLTTAAACYFALKRRWLPYALWGIAAALTRMTGLLVIVPALAELLRGEQCLRPPVRQSMKKSLRPAAARLPLIFAPLLGTGGYLLLNFIVDGDPFAFAVHQRHWYQGGMWISEVLRYLWRYLGQNGNTANGWAIWLPELVLFVLFFGLLALSALRRETPDSLLLFGALYFAANYSLSWLLSAGRYLAGGFVFFLLAAALLREHPVLRRFLPAVEAVFLGVFLFAYAAGAQVM